MERELHPVELGEHVVGEVERPVGADVALGAAQDAEGSEQLVRRRDLLALAAEVVRGQTRDDADVRRVVADREVLIAELLRGAGHLLDRGLPVRPRRMHVQIAADLGHLDERRRLAPEAVLAQLRRYPGQPELRVDGLLVDAFGKLAERGDVLRGAGGPHELGAVARGCRNRELQRNALDRDAERAALVPLHDGDDRRQRGEALEHRDRISRSDDDAELVGEVLPAARVAGRLAVERDSGRLDERTCAVQQQSGTRPAAVARETRQDVPLGLRADSGNLAEAAGLRRRAELVHGAHAERAADLDEALRPDPEEPAEPDQLRLDLALELVQLRDRPRLDELLQPRLDARPDAAELTRAALANELRDGRGSRTDQLRRPAVRTGRVVAAAGEVEQPGKGLQPLRDRCVVGSGGAGHADSLSAR